MKKIIISTLISMMVTSAFTQVTLPSDRGKVKWLGIEEAEKMMKSSPKPLFIDAYTDWCGWCKKMDQDTFSHPVIAEILNNKFYPVKFNAEGQEEITFLGQTFINDGKAGKTHQLAIALLQGELSYPTVVFLTPDEEKIYVTPIKGYRQAKEMEMILGYFADNKFKTQSVEEYQKNYTGTIK